MFFSKNRNTSSFVLYYFLFFTIIIELFAIFALICEFINLCNFTFTFINSNLYDNAALPNIARIILAAVTTFAISTAISWITPQFKITRIFIK